MPTTKPRPAPLRWASAVFQPRAACEECEWSRPPNPHTRQDAKNHARQHPGHLVIVDVVSRHQYWTDS